MNREIHFKDVGQGNMVHIKAADGQIFVCDCNITDDNEYSVISYLEKVIGYGREIKAFICTDRDADHLRGISTLHDHFSIQAIWESGYPGTSLDTPEYMQCSYTIYI